MMERKTGRRRRVGRRDRVLQWGRSDDGAENSGLDDARPEYDALQWGRSDDGAENASARAANLFADDCFNGAAPMMERKTGLFGRNGEARELQWGRSDDGAENEVAASEHVNVVSLQWGRSDDGAENAPSRVSTGTIGSSFNGAAPMMERKTTRPPDRVKPDDASMGPLR